MDKMRSIVTTAAAIILPLCATAQQPDSLKVNLQEVTVVATKTEKKIIETGRSITVITRDQIESSAYSTIGELLSQQEGIYVVGSGQTPGANQSIFMRGANSNQTVVMIDGVKINDASTVNNTIDLSELPLAGVERIEIIRGSHSTLYGSSAIGGVINILTSKKVKEGFSAGMTVKAGTFGKSTSAGEGSFQATIGTKSGVYLNGFFDQLHVEGMDATLDTASDPNIFKNRDKDGWDKTTTRVMAGYENARWKIETAYRYLSMKTDLDKGAYTDDENYTLEFKRNLVSTSVRLRQNDKLHYQFRMCYTNTFRSDKNNPSLIDSAGNTDMTTSRNYYWGYNYFGEATVNYNVPHLSLIAGISGEKELMDSKGYYYTSLFFPPYYYSYSLDSKPRSELQSVFVQADINGGGLKKSLEPLSIVAGVRYNHHSLFSKNFSFEINPSYRLSANSLVFISWSTGFNAPSLYQLYAPDKNTISGITLGNQQLNPETSQSFEAGIKENIDNRIEFGISIYKTITRDVIDFVYLWDKNIEIDLLGTDFTRDDNRGYTYLNTGKQITKGIEISLGSRLSEKFFVRANLSLVDGQIEFNPDEIDTAETGGNHIQLFSNGAFLTNSFAVQGLTRRPRSTANVQFTYMPFQKLTTTLGLQYVDSRNDIYFDYNIKPYGALAEKSVKAYELLNFSSRYLLNKNYSIVLTVENLLNTRYEEIYGYSTRGRGVYLRVTFDW